MTPHPHSSALLSTGLLNHLCHSELTLSMETGRPPVKLSEELALGSAPKAVYDPVQILVQDEGCAIPASMRRDFEAYDPDTAQQMSESAFTTDAQLYNWGNDGWAQVQTIHHRAGKCNRRFMDESAWCDVVRLVLELALDAAGVLDMDFALEINNVQSQALDSTFLPRTTKRGGISKSVDRKIDFAIAVDTEKGFHLTADPEQVPVSMLKKLSCTSWCLTQPCSRTWKLCMDPDPATTLRNHLIPRYCLIFRYHQL
jgi:hypothetical protein